MDTEALWQNYLPQTRWFQGKGLDIRVLQITALPWYVQDDHCWVRSELAQVESALGLETYHLLVGYQPVGTADSKGLIGRTTLAEGEFEVLDAPLSPFAMSVFLRGIASCPTQAITWFETPPLADTNTKVFSGEQSNTNVLVGEHVLLKIIRRLPVGRSLESELLHVLATSGMTPRLFGTLTSPATNQDLAIFSERIEQAQDGWDFATKACQANMAIGGELEHLGAALRRIHQSLAQAYGISAIEASQVRNLMRSRLGQACGQVPALAALRESLLCAFDGLGVAQLEVQRLHGDFHLGQALISKRGWFIIDFEGEPLKSPEERRAPDSVWRDVAGLTRSIDYVRSSHPDPCGKQANAWYQDARDGFLQGYLGEKAKPSILQAYEVDKAIYELVYETRNRPDWVGIPWRALQDAANVSTAP